MKKSKSQRIKPYQIEITPQSSKKTQFPLFLRDIVVPSKISLSSILQNRSPQSASKASFKASLQDSPLGNPNIPSKYLKSAYGKARAFTLGALKLSDNISVDAILASETMEEFADLTQSTRTTEWIYKQKISKLFEITNALKSIIQDLIDTLNEVDLEPLGNVNKGKIQEMVTKASTFILSKKACTAPDEYKTKLEVYKSRLAAMLVDQEKTNEELQKYRQSVNTGVDSIKRSIIGINETKSITRRENDKIAKYDSKPALSASPQNRLKTAGAELESLKVIVRSLIVTNKHMEAGSPSVESFESEYTKIVPCDTCLALNYSSQKSLFTGSNGIKRVTITPTSSKYLFNSLACITKPMLMNKVPLKDSLAKPLESFLGQKINNYMAIPWKDVTGTLSGMLLFINSSEGFTRVDETLAYLIVNAAKLVGKYKELQELYTHEKEQKEMLYPRAKELLSCKTMGEFMETIANQCRKIAKAERVNVLFYDQTRNEFYKRIKTANGETIKVYTVSKGIAGVCIHSLSPVVCSNVSEDIRFYPLLDDAEWNRRGNEAKSLVAVPIIGYAEKSLDGKMVPKGVIVAINSNSGAFTTENTDDLVLYNDLVGKAFDIITKLEYFYSMGKQVSKMGEQAVHVMNSMEITGTTFMQLEKGFLDMQTALNKGNKLV